VEETNIHISTYSSGQEESKIEQNHLKSLLQTGANLNLSDFLYIS